MFLILNNSKEIENWFYENTGNINAIHIFNERIFNINVINTMIIENKKENSIKLLLKQSYLYQLIISDDKSMVINYLLKLKMQFNFHNLDQILNIVNNIYIVNSEINPDNSLLNSLANNICCLN